MRFSTASSSSVSKRRIFDEAEELQTLVLERLLPRHILRLGQNRTHRIPGTPRVDIVVMTGGDRLEIRIATAKRMSVPRSLNFMARISVSSGGEGDSRQLTVGTSATGLFPEFYHMGLLIADRVQVAGDDPVSAVEAGLSAMRSLAAQQRGLSPTEELGLLGELWTLRRLLDSLKARAVKSWLGPGRREHDFRLGNTELEVKTTSRVRRIHTIHGLGQLRPSEGRRLFLLSLHVSPAGSGEGFSAAKLRSEIIGNC